MRKFFKLFTALFFVFLLFGCELVSTDDVLSSKNSVRSAKEVSDDMLLVFGGSFVMKDSSKKITLNDYYICKHTVTQAEFCTVMNLDKSFFGSSKDNDGENSVSARNISWYATIAYCNKKSLAEGLVPCYKVSGVSDWKSLSYSEIPAESKKNWDNAVCDMTASGYRLPTEVEIEFSSVETNENEWCWDLYEEENSVSSVQKEASVRRVVRAVQPVESEVESDAEPYEALEPFSAKDDVSFRVVCSVQKNTESSGNNSVASGSSSSASAKKDDGMRFVTGGTFVMGSASGTGTVRSVAVNSFYICNHEITQAEFSSIMKTNPSYFSGGAADGESQSERPVERVNWYRAIAYCNKRSIAEGLKPCYIVSGVNDWASLSYGSIPTMSDANWDDASCDWNADGYRLPTEAEWEYAARGGEKSGDFVYSGSRKASDVAWCSGGNANKTHEVMKKEPNELGLYDMSGNVMEWCWDWFGEYSSGNVDNPRGSVSGSNRVARGGFWGSREASCAVTERFSYVPKEMSIEVGFRVVRAVGIPEITSGVYSAEDEAVELSWTVPDAASLDHVEITYSCRNGNETISFDNVYKASKSISSKTFTGINPDYDFYTYSVVCVDKAGNKSAAATKRVLVGIAAPEGFVYVDGGSFSMGGSAGVYGSSAVQKVSLSDFYMCDRSVTQGEFEEVMGANPSCFQEDSVKNKPVERVNWYAAIAYCNKRSIAEGFEPCYEVKGIKDWKKLSYDEIPVSSNKNWDKAVCDWTASGYRLPTEAEWEFAARGGSSGNGYEYSGSNSVDDVAWYRGNSGNMTHEVRLKTENDLGIYDMSGNVMEWCWDWFGDFSGTDCENPRGAESGSGRVVRGGSWDDYASSCSVSFRKSIPPGYSDISGHLGIRVVRSVL